MEERIRRLLQENRPDEAIAQLDRYRADGGTMDAGLFYLLGNAWRKKGSWQLAINNYLEAVHLDPESLAAQALDIANEIMAFYNKDMYNQ